jgi:acyl-CoA synthetase (AMP-forming)/AMP-acid ligase II
MTGFDTLEVARNAQGAEVARSGRLTVYELFRAQVRRAPERIAIESGAVSQSYATLDARVRALSSALLKLGVRRGDRIAILSENRPEYVETELAAACIGAIVACQNWRLSSTELQHCLDLVSPVLVLISPRFEPVLQSIERHGVPVLLLGEAYEDMLAGAPSEFGCPEVDPEDGLVILYTSGTTGLPKGALISHRAEIARMCVLRMDLNVDAEDAFLAWAPMFHMGSTDQVIGALITGAAVVIVDGFDAQAIVDTIARRKLGWLLLMPGSIEPVAALMKEQAIVAKGVKAAGAMADLVPTQLIAELSALMNAPYLNSFGSTETGLAPASAMLIPKGSVPAMLSKRQSSLCEVKLVDPDDREVRTGEPGEIAIRGPTVFSGYWNAAKTNAWDFRGGWFHMGDLFRRNEDGSFDFVDRVKYMIKSGGENIYPAEVERVLLADPRVADAVVVRKKDAKWGEVPVAFVARLQDSLTIQDVETICRQGLAGYKRPREIRFVSFAELPRSTTGKILRHEIERWLLEGVAG